MNLIKSWITKWVKRAFITVVFNLTLIGFVASLFSYMVVDKLIRIRQYKIEKSLKKKKPKEIFVINNRDNSEILYFMS